MLRAGTALVVADRVSAWVPAGVGLHATSGTALARELASVRCHGRTAVHDAVVATLERLRPAHHLRRGLILLSDGEDTASTTSLAQALAEVTRSDVVT